MNVRAESAPVVPAAPPGGSARRSAEARTAPAAAPAGPARGSAASFGLRHLAAGGMAVALAEAVRLVIERPLRDRGDLLLAAGALAAVVPVAWSAAAGIVLAAVRGVRRLTSNPGARLLAFTAAGAAVLLPFTLELGSGPWVSSMPAAAVLPFAAALLGGASAAAGLGAVARCAARGRCAAAAGATVLLAAAAGGVLADRHLFPAFYPAAHALLAMGAVLAAALGVWLAAPRAAPGRRLAISASALMILAAAFAGSRALAHPAIVQAWLDRTATGAPLVRALLLLGHRPGGLQELDAAAFRRLADAAPASRAPLSAGARPARAVVVITLEATRVDHLGFGGYGRPTSPALDRFAAESLVCLEGWCAANSSHEALVALFGARYPGGTSDAVGEVLSGVRAAGTRAIAWFPDGNLLRHRDLFGAWDEVHAYGQRAEEIVAPLDARLAAAEAAGSPLFLWLHLFDPHAPYEPQPGDRVFGAEDVDRYDGEIRAMDRAFGRIVEVIDRWLGREDVVIAVTADHGESFGEGGAWFHKSGLGEEQIRVPVLVRGLGVPPGRRGGFASHVDVLPTAFAAAGWPLPAGDGCDLRDLDAPASRAVFCRHEGRAIAARRGRWKVEVDLRTGHRRAVEFPSGPADASPPSEDVGPDLVDILTAFDGAPGGLLGLTYGEAAIRGEARCHLDEAGTPAGAFACRLLALRQ